MSARTRAWIALAFAVILEVGGSLSMKAALEAPWLFLLTGTGYAGAFVLLAQALRMGMPLGVAYGAWAAAGVALTAVLSAVVFAEPFTPVMGVGIVLIAVGVLCVELGSSLPATGRGQQTPGQEPPGPEPRRQVVDV
ncbi:MAG: DMT family transporter [Brevibacterium yomogidense]|uniref:DMT family transporter n=1 Tax=Brevibacterium sp. Mu109 TaxID=1255669 RepID=UPI000C5AA2C3|nr:SMR family transporter [Brevibacterium sp. Mu109]SMX81406.1 small multidrug resistance pump [Brevibacterium sp. Mu109]